MQKLRHWLLSIPKRYFAKKALNCQANATLLLVYYWPGTMGYRMGELTLEMSKLYSSLSEAFSPDCDEDFV